MAAADGIMDMLMNIMPEPTDVEVFEKLLSADGLLLPLGNVRKMHPVTVRPLLNRRNTSVLHTIQRGQSEHFQLALASSRCDAHRA
jgi:hypothetical protein